MGGYLQKTAALLFCQEFPSITLTIDMTIHVCGKISKFMLSNRYPVFFPVYTGFQKPYLGWAHFVMPCIHNSFSRPAGELMVQDQK